MQDYTIIGERLDNIPWEDKPAGCRDAVWRYTGKPHYSAGSDSVVKQHFQQRGCTV